MKDIITFEL